MVFTKEEAEKKALGRGFAHPNFKGGYIVVIMHKGLMWALVSDTEMVHLDEW